MTIETLSENPSSPPFTKGRNHPSFAKRGRGDFAEPVHSISRQSVSPGVDGVAFVVRDGCAQRPRSRRASPAVRGVLAVRRSAGGAKRNADIGLSAQPHFQIFRHQVLLPCLVFLKCLVSGMIDARRVGDGCAQRPRSRRASPAVRGVLAVRRSAGGAKRNADIGLSAQPSSQRSMSGRI